MMPGYDFRPMRTLYFDFSSGCAGDMFLAALIDAGLLSVEDFTEGVERLGLPDVGVEFFKDIRGGVTGTRLRVLRGGRPVEEVQGISATASALGMNRRRRSAHERDRHAHSPNAEHGPDAHGDPHSHTHSSSHSHSHSHDDHPHRHLSEILAVVEDSGLPREVKKDSLELFERLAEIEGRIHGVAPSEVHLHEVSADDSIVDIALSAWAMNRLRRRFGALTVTGSPVNVGHGTFGAAHGRLPVPPPAVVELLRGRPTYGAGDPGERCTPTGALLIDRYVDRHEAQPPMIVREAGYGLGTKEFADGPNALRVLAGEPAAGEENGERIVLLEADLDDSTGEWIGWARERLLEAGALDVVTIGTSMKKGRPGVLVRVLARPESKNRLAEILFAETSTLGVRFFEGRREICEREVVKVSTASGIVAVKIARRGGTIVNIAAEQSTAAEIARSTGRPLKAIMREAEVAASGVVEGESSRKTAKPQLSRVRLKKKESTTGRRS